MNELNDMNKSLNDGGFQYVWIGLQKTGRIKWHWPSGEPALDLKWAPGQPDGTDNCAMMLNGELHDLPCNDNRHFICNNSECSYNYIFAFFILCHKICDTTLKQFMYRHNSQTHNNDNKKTLRGNLTIGPCNRRVIIT